MNTAIFKGPGSVAAGERPDPVIQEPTDAVGGNFGNGIIDGGQGEAVRVPQAGGTLVSVPERRAIKSLVRVGTA